MNTIVTTTGQQVTVEEETATVMLDGQTLHPMLAQANNALWFADTVGVGIFVRQAPEFADDHSEDTIVIVVRGQDAVKLGREALVATARLVTEAH